MMSKEPTDTLNSRRPKSGQGRRGKWRKGLVYLLAAIILGLIVYGMWPNPIEVETAKVTRGPLVVSVLEEGKTRIRHRYTISAPIAGLLNRVPLRAGAPIEAGKTVLATIEPQMSAFLDPRAKAQGEARVRTAEATRMLREAELSRAKEALELAEKEFARADELLKSNSISRQEWDTAENRVKLLTREVNSAKFASRVADFEIAQAKAALLPATANLSMTTEPLTITAPVDGYILSVQEESARSIAAGAPIMEVGDPRDLEAEIEMLSSDAVMVAPGAEVSIERWGGETPLRGRVSLVEQGGFTKISALGVEEQRVRVRVDFLDTFPAGHELGDRFRVEARIVTWRSDSVLQVPTGALFRRGSNWMTFIVSDGKAHLQPVEINHNNGTVAEVVSGLKDGQPVILYPPDRIADGTALTIKQAKPAS